MSELHRDRRRVIRTRSGCYRVAWIPLARSPLPGFRACAVQAVPVDNPRHAVRLVLYERLVPRTPEEDERSVA